MAMGAGKRLTEPTDPGVVRLVRLECVDGRSSKAYSLVIQADVDAEGRCLLDAEWGRIGGNVNRQRKAFGSQTECERKLAQLVTEKQRKGYRVVLDERNPEPARRPRSPGAPKPGRPRQPAEEPLEVVLAWRKTQARWSF